MNLRLFLKIVSPLWIFANVLEVALPTQKTLNPVYVTEIHATPSEFDSSHLSNLRKIFLYDLNTSGISKVLSKKEHLEKSAVKAEIDVALWKKEKIPFVILFQVFDGRLRLNVFDIERAKAKEYPGLPLTGDLDQDRREVHRIGSLIQKDLFGNAGISMLKLIYAKRLKEKGEWISQLWMCDADGGNDHSILSDEGYCVSPAFFPHEKSYYYVSFRDGQSKIYHANLGERESDVLITLRGSQVLPSVSRRGDQMAFITDAAGSPDLFIQNLAGGKPIGKPKQLISAPKVTHASPTYSPDGKKIAYVSDKEGSPRIYVMDLSVREPKKITHINRENTSPSWSPDGRKIAYSAKVDGVRQIWVYDVETDTEEPITKGPENKENPSWAPDSLHLVYNTESNETCELYQLHINQGLPIRVSKGAHQKRFASWAH